MPQPRKKLTEKQIEGLVELIVSLSFIISGILVLIFAPSLWKIIGVKLITDGSDAEL